jgi:hypothetical protein
MTSPSQILFHHRKAEPEDRIIRNPLDDDATPQPDSLRAVTSKPTADPLILPMSADNDFPHPNCDSAERHILFHIRRTIGKLSTLRTR